MAKRKDETPIELTVVDEIQLGEIIEMGYSGLPVFGTTPVVPLFLSYRNPQTGETETLRLALSPAKLRELEAPISNRLGEQEFDLEDPPSLN